MKIMSTFLSDLIQIHSGITYFSLDFAIVLQDFAQFQWKNVISVM